MNTAIKPLYFQVFSFTVKNKTVDPKLSHLY